MLRTFVIGDIHGAHRALSQCFERSGFDPESDRLIALGDSCDGWPDVYEVMETLAGLPNRVYILGNHDQWALEWARTGQAAPVWLYQGGEACLEAYPEGMPESHLQILETALLYYEEDGLLFTHGGFDPGIPLDRQGPETFLWDRELAWQAATRGDEGGTAGLTSYRQVYLGHTPTTNFGSSIPIRGGKIILMDTGAGWQGCLSLMNIETGEWFQSDPVPELYPGIQGRLH